MATTVTSRVILDFLANARNQDEETKTAEHRLLLRENRSSGSGVTEVDAVYSDLSLTLSASATTLDLQTLTDSFGDSLDLAKIFWIAVYNTATTAGYDLTIGNAAANPWEPFVTTTTETIEIPDGGYWIWGDPTTGATVDASNSDLKLDPGANTIVAKLLIVGTKA